MHNEDAMAVEELGEGMRKFDTVARKLKQFARVKMTQRMASWMETESSGREPKSCGSPARGQAHECAINPRAAKYPRGHRWHP
jgi:hypothetical protein